MRKYKQLTIIQRYQISALIEAGFEKFEISIRIGVSQSTICRELLRNKGPGNYDPERAEKAAEFRKRSLHKHSKITKEMAETIKEKLQEQLSPEQISGSSKRMGIKMVSHESIYNFIRIDAENGGSLYKNLRHSRKKRKKYGEKENRGQLKNRVSIDMRPEIVDKKTRIGDWEGDLIIGKDHKGAIVTLVERKSKVVLAKKISSKGSKEVENAIKEMLAPFMPISHTLTLDNGKEFANHEAISKALGIKIYFAHPYSSWERGLNENTNGLIRQYWPKKTNFENVSDKEIQEVICKLNLRPRKILGFASPAEALANCMPRW